MGKWAERSNLSVVAQLEKELGEASGQRLGPREHPPLPATGWSSTDHR